MLFKRQESRRRFPFCTMAVCAMTVIGACAVVSATKEKMCEMADMAKAMLKKKKPCQAKEGCHEHRCPVCGEVTE